jgi:hypothetical protein
VVRAQPARVDCDHRRHVRRAGAAGRRRAPVLPACLARRPLHPRRGAPPGHAASGASQPRPHPCTPPPLQPPDQRCARTSRRLTCCPSSRQRCSRASTPSSAPPRWPAPRWHDALVVLVAAAARPHCCPPAEAPAAGASRASLSVEIGLQQQYLSTRQRTRRAAPRGEAPPGPAPRRAGRWRSPAQGRAPARQGGFWVRSREGGGRAVGTQGVGTHGVVAGTPGVGGAPGAGGSAARRRRGVRRLARGGAATARRGWDGTDDRERGGGRRAGCGPVGIGLEAGASGWLHVHRGYIQRAAQPFLAPVHGGPRPRTARGAPGLRRPRRLVRLGRRPAQGSAGEAGLGERLCRRVSGRPMKQGRRAPPRAARAGAGRGWRRSTSPAARLPCRPGLAGAAAAGQPPGGAMKRRGVSEKERGRGWGFKCCGQRARGARGGGALCRARAAGGAGLKGPPRARRGCTRARVFYVLAMGTWLGVSNADALPRSGRSARGWGGGGLCKVRARKAKGFLT